MNTNKISVESLIKDIMDYSGHEGEINKKLIKKIIHDHLDFLNPPTQLKESVALIDIEDYKGELPEGFRSVIQAGYIDASTQKRVTKREICQFKKPLYGQGCELEINLKCDKCQQIECRCSNLLYQVDVDDMFLKAHPEYAVAHTKHFYDYGNTYDDSTFYHPKFRLMRTAQNSFWNANHYIEGCVNIDFDCEVEYRIDKPNIIVNFKRGQVLMGYFGEQLIDGYRAVPDTSAVLKSIRYAVEEALAFIAYKRTKERADRAFWREMTELNEMWTGRAYTELIVPDEDEFLDFVTNHWTKMIPYSDWFRNLNRRMPDKFKYPNETLNFD